MNYDDYMRALRGRIESLVGHLTACGYRLARPSDALGIPAAAVEQQLEKLQNDIGVVPAALAAFYRVVGSVDLTGQHPGWAGCDYPDGLVVYPIDVALSEAYQYLELEDPRAEYWASESGVFRIPIAPDEYHKENISGGMWYGVEIPNASDDPVVLEEGHDLPFTEYLELALHWGGFPGLEHAAKDHTWPLDELRQAASRRTRG